MNCLKLLTIFFTLNVSLLAATEFTICSYNCGGLSDHYDYLCAASWEKLMQERYIAEPEAMALNEKIQKVALKLLFSSDSIDKNIAQQEWEQKGYQERFEYLTSAPTERKSPNKIWHEKAKSMITAYNVRPIVVSDAKVNHMLDEHLSDVSKTPNASKQEQLQEGWYLMATRIFANHLNYDIICLQEADYLTSSMFPENYEVSFSKSARLNGIAWNKERFELVVPIEEIQDKVFVVQLRDKESAKTILIASGHLTGCDPYHSKKNPKTGISDAEAGDRELQAIVDILDSQEADLMIIGMDSNVTSLHPRMKILKNAGYMIDYENYIEPTCTNPYQVLNTRIDWIALKSPVQGVSITNIPVLSIGLNNIQTNISDHKPIAAKIDYNIQFYN